jgi:hypothetical protein
LEDVHTTGTPGSATDFGSKHAFPASKISAGGWKLERGCPADLIDEFVAIAGPVLIVIAAAGGQEGGGAGGRGGVAVSGMGTGRISRDGVPA